MSGSVGTKGNDSDYRMVDMTQDRPQGRATLPGDDDRGGPHGDPA